MFEIEFLCVDGGRMRDVPSQFHLMDSSTVKYYPVMHHFSCPLFLFTLSRVSTLKLFCFRFELSDDNVYIFFGAHTSKVMLKSEKQPIQAHVIDASH